MNINGDKPLKLDIETNHFSSTILFPLSNESEFALVADISDFKVCNSKNEEENSIDAEALHVTNVEITNINMFVGKIVGKSNDMSKLIFEIYNNFGDFTVLPLGNTFFKEACNCKFQINHNMDTNIVSNIPNTKITGSISKISAVINLFQYKSIKEFIYCNLGDTTDNMNNFGIEENKCHVKENTFVANTLLVNFELENISILLDNDSTFKSEVNPFVCIDLLKSSIEINSFEDNTRSISFISKEIRIVDTKRDSQSFTNAEILNGTLQTTKKNFINNLAQFEFHIRRTPLASKFVILFNNMKVIALSHRLRNLRNFFITDSKVNYKNSSIPKSKINKQTEGSLPIEIVLNINNTELVFEEKCNHKDLNAIILKSNTIISYKPKNTSNPLSIDISYLEMFSCILGLEDETALSIIDPFKMKMEVQRECLEVLIQNELNIRLSYNDLKLIKNIFEAIPQTNSKSFSYVSQNYDFEVIAPLIAMGFSQTDSWYAMKLHDYKLNDAALWLSQQKDLKITNPLLEIHKLVINACYVSVCIIDDCMDADVPLLELSLSKVILKQNIKEKIRDDVNVYIPNLEGKLEATIVSDYYNRCLSGWEPVVEPWECSASWKYCKNNLKANNICNILLSSKQLLKVNITTNFVGLCNIVHKNWTEDFFGIDKSELQLHNLINLKRRTPFIPYAIENLTGEPLLFKKLYSQPGGITRTEVNQQDMMCDWIPVHKNHILPFDFGPQTKLRHLDSHKLNQHQIFVQIHGWTLIGPITVDKVGTFFRYSNLDFQYRKKTRIVFKISLVGSAQKLITVKSALNIVNKLDIGIYLKMEMKNQEKASIVELKTNDILSVPLRHIDSLIYIKPCLNDLAINSKAYAAYSQTEIIDFCSVGIMWDRCKDNIFQQLCSCFMPDKKVFYSLVEIQSDKYPTWELNIPGHTITILPPLRINNMLCCDLLFEISKQTGGRIPASQLINIHDVNIFESFQISITLDNFKRSGQLNIPVGHTGIVEPKVKLVDMLNRELFLRVSIQSIKGNRMEIFVSAPVWIINKTGLPLIFKQEGSTQLSAGQFEEHEAARMVTPLPFSFSDQEGSASIEMRLGNNSSNTTEWSKSVNIHKEITFREVRSDVFNSCYYFGINTHKGRGVYSCTRFVTISPRYRIFNKTSYNLELVQKCDIHSVEQDNFVSALAGCNFPLHWKNSQQEVIICVRNADIEFCYWSNGFSINKEQSFFINMRNDLAEMFFLRVQIILNNATFNLIFTDAQSFPPPIRFDNFSKVLINFSQVGCKPFWRTTIRPESSLSYALDDPMGDQVIHLEAPGGSSLNFSLKEFSVSHNITYSNFLYIVFEKTFQKEISDSESVSNNIDCQQLVLAVRDKKVIITKKCIGDRSQLWLMNLQGQLEHEGSSPPIETEKAVNKSIPRMVLDVEKAVNPREYTKLVIRAPNKQRITTQTWRFENGRLLCHANMCVQAINGVQGMQLGMEVVLGQIFIDGETLISTDIPIEQNIVTQKLRLGSGHLNVTSKMDGPIHAIIIQDVLQNQEILLAADLSWNYTSLITKKTSINDRYSLFGNFSFDVELKKGLGLSIVSTQPCEELLYITFENIVLKYISTTTSKSINFRVADVQIDNQLFDSHNCSVLLHTPKTVIDNQLEDALVYNAKLLTSPNKNAVIFESMTLHIKPCVVVLEERLVLKIAVFLKYSDNSKIIEDVIKNNTLQNSDIDLLTSNTTRYFFENLCIGKTEVRLSFITAQKLHRSLAETKKQLGMSFIKFEDALIEFDMFSNHHQFETLSVYLKAIKSHYKNQLKWHAASILGSVDFLGNPLGFANDLSEGVSGLIFEGSVKGLFRNVAHGISNSTAKLTETLSDSLGKVVLDDYDKETRQKILEIQTKSSTSHLAAGFKGLGFGLLGGVTSIVRNSYTGAQSDGFPGFISGIGKGLVGTVTKPLIGVLDLTAETACAIRESSKGSNRTLPDRRRLPRCVTGAPGGLLPIYSHRQSRGQQYLYYINHRNFLEKLISYEPNLCNDKEAKLRLLVSNEYIRIFSRCDDDPTLMLECHLSEVLSCHPLTTNVFLSDLVSKGQPSYYIEISTNSPKITRPRVRCQNEDVAERASRHINYAKSIYDEREQTILQE